MKWMIAVAAVCGIGLSIAKAADAPPSPAGPDKGKLVAHEWGTFTGLAGSDGVHLAFRTSISADLPEFVLNHSKQLQRSDDKSGLWLDLLLGKDGVLALQRMETPVVYFYTDRPRDLDVRVDFPQGKITEFYPPVRDFEPRPGRRSDQPQYKQSFVDWGRIRIEPDPSLGKRTVGGPGTRIPPVLNGNHYVQARATDAAIVQFSDRPNEVHEEKFLFYRGLGNFTLPVKFTAQGDGKFALENTGPDAIGTAFLVEIGAEPTKTPARFAAVENVRGRVELTFPPTGTVQCSLGDAIVAALVKEGLYEKEAQAMVATWEKQWLHEPGIRVLYTVPRRATDELLPLKITPSPDETVRVLVGRIDVLTPELERTIVSHLTAPGARIELTAAQAGEIRRLGRFMHPAIERAIALTPDPKKARERYIVLTRAVYAHDKPVLPNLVPAANAAQ